MRLHNRRRTTLFAQDSHRGSENREWISSYLKDLFGGAAAQGQAEKKARELAGPAPSGSNIRWPWWFVLPIQPGEYRYTHFP